VLSKRGLCSRSQAEALVRAGRVQLDGRTVTDPEHPTDLQHARIEVAGMAAARAERACIALNKPRGLVTTRADERGRKTVYHCLQDSGLPWLAPVGRLDQASEGLLLFSNDPAWAAAVCGAGVPKTYHVQVQGVPDAEVLARLAAGVDERGEHLAAERVALLRSGGRTAWLEFVLRGGRNRQIRRMLAAVELDVLRLLRVAIGPVTLGELPKGSWRRLTDAEVHALAPDL
jgi:23S rRNA pseudouridine2605 synthase